MPYKKTIIAARMLTTNVYHATGSVSVNGEGPRESVDRNKLKKAIPLPFILDKYRNTRF
jgi:hypothetical protein